jgi:hypothetical protein
MVTSSWWTHGTTSFEGRFNRTRENSKRVVRSCVVGILPLARLPRTL